MNKLTVTHFVRKSSQLRAPFIQNQILFHNRYNPKIVYKNLSTIDDGGFADFNNSNINTLFLNEDASNFSRMKYKFLKLITKKDRDKITEYINNSDILHFHYGTDAGIFLPLLKNVKIPKVVSFYGYDCFGFAKIILGYGRRYLKKRVFKIADKVFAMSPEMKIDLLALGCSPKKIIVHYHGSDVKSFKMARYYNKKKNINFLIISGLQPEKGHLFLIKAFHKVFNNEPTKILNIVGDGPCREDIQTEIARRGINNIILHSKVIYKSEEHLNFLQKADVFVHPSIITKEDKEGIPGAIIEAMSSGLPVISTFVGGIPFVIHHMKTGILVKEKDVEGLSNAMVKLAKNTDMRMDLGRNGQRYALENLDIEFKEKELEKIYDSLI